MIAEDSMSDEEKTVNDYKKNFKKLRLRAEDWRSRKPLQFAFVLALVVGLIGIGIGIGIAKINVYEDLEKALFNYSVALIFGVLIGGIVKLLIDEHQKLRDQHAKQAQELKEQRANQAQFITNALDDLKSVYDRVERSRILIATHRSAKRYGTEMINLIEARVQLRNVIRALDLGPKDIPDKQLRQVQLAVSTMEAYLEMLTNAFERDYIEASRKQKIYEAEVDRIVKDKEVEASLIMEIKNEAWEVILDMPETKGFIGEEPKDKIDSTSEDKELEYARCFEHPLDLGTWILRNELQATLGRKRADMPKHHSEILEKMQSKTCGVTKEKQK
jgi:hypothetical protein